MLLVGHSYQRFAMGSSLRGKYSSEVFDSYSVYYAEYNEIIALTCMYG